jgi:hypothetical protein
MIKTWHWRLAVLEAVVDVGGLPLGVVPVVHVLRRQLTQDVQHLFFYQCLAPA